MNTHVNLDNSIEMRSEMMGWIEKMDKTNISEDWLKVVEEFAFTKGHEVVNCAGGIDWIINGVEVAETLASSLKEFFWFDGVVNAFVDKINNRKVAIRMEKKRAEKKMRDEENKKNNMVNVDSLMTSINNLRTRNSELVSQVGKMKNEIKSANDEIAELKKMLEMATLKIAELEDANQELAIYKEMVEEETKIEE